MLRAIILLLLISCLSASALATCPPANVDLAQLSKLKQDDWKISDPQLRQKTALALLDCLADPDPILRDEIAFEALSAWMRGDQLDNVTTRSIFQVLLPELLAVPDANGFIQPFAVLTLAEVARVDRIKPFLTTEERQRLVSAAAKYLSQLRDYRGFDQTTGWRHGVAHSADLMLQLSLNPALARAQHDEMLTAIATQVANPRHFFQYGEGKRLMVPVFYLGRRGNYNATEWDNWFSVLMAPLEKPAATTQVRLAKTHNLQAFLFPLYFSLQESGDKIQKENMLPSVIKAIKKLP
jgi:hypothetical protein